MGLNNSLYQGKTYATSDDLAGIIRPDTIKFIENPREILFRNPHPVISHYKLNKLSPVLDANGNLSTLPVILHRITHQIGNNGFHTLPVGMNGEELRVYGHLKFQALFFYFLSH